MLYTVSFNVDNTLPLFNHCEPVYDPEILSSVLSHIQQSQDTRLSCLVIIGRPETLPSIPVYIHLPPSSEETLQASNITLHKFSRSPYFLLPHAADYDSGEATLAHSRVLVFLRKHIGGPVFDIEAIWEEHTYFEFQMRSVAKTMGTMVVSPSPRLKDMR